MLKRIPKVLLRPASPRLLGGQVHVAVIPQTLDNLFLREGVISTEKPCSVSMLAAGGFALKLVI